MSLLDPTQNTLVHKKDNGNTLVVESGGQIILMPGAKIGPNGSTVALPIASANQANVTQTQTALTDNSGGTPSTTLAVITPFSPSVAWNGSSVFPSAADATALAAADTSTRNAVASLKAELTLIKADVAALIVQNTALCAALISANIIKGSA